MAEGVGFEPTVRLPVRLISSQVPSTNSATLPFSEQGGEDSKICGNVMRISFGVRTNVGSQFEKQAYSFLLHAGFRMDCVDTLDGLGPSD